MKSNQRLRKIVGDMEGKSKREMTNILLKEKILVPVQRVNGEFHVIQTRKNIWERIKGKFK
jgi:hypothetical protein